MENSFHPADNPSAPPVARIIRSSFIRGLGGFGGRKNLQHDPRPVAPKIPNRAPDAVVSKATSPQQALLYRLSGDFNPLHADVDIAQSVGFERPILHGLCSFGFAVQTVLRSFPGIQVKAVSCRFSSPVLPGQVLTISMWRESPEWILFKVDVAGKAVLSDGFVQVFAARL